MSAADTLGPIDLVKWARDLLTAIKRPTSTENLVSVVAWALKEGGHNANSRAWNPLNTTQKWPGATYGGAQGNIASYASYADGLGATVKTVTNGRYGGILAELAASTNASIVGADHDLVTWGTINFVPLIPRARTMVAQAGGGTSSTVTTPSAPSTATQAATSAGSLTSAPSPFDVSKLPPIDFGNRLAALTVAGGGLPTWLVDRLTSAKLSLSTSEVTQLTLVFDDPDLTVIGATGGSSIDPTPLWDAQIDVNYGPLKLAVAGTEVGAGDSGRGSFTVTARPAAVFDLSSVKGPVTVKNISPSDFVAYYAGGKGLYVVAQPSPVRGSVTIAGAKNAGDTPETAWDAFGRLATELGYLMFEAAGVLFFGQPSWLVAQLPVHPITWVTAGAGNIDPNVIGMPSVRKVANPGDDTTTIDVTVTLAGAALASGWLVGSSILLSGIPTYSGTRYLIGGIEADLADVTSPVTVTAQFVTDPKPQPPTDGSAGAPADGGGATSSAAATDNPPKDWKATGPGHQWAHPLAGKGHDSHNFGQHRAATSVSKAHIHEGTDLGVPVGTPVYAAHAGTVASAGVHSGYGNAIYLEHPGDFVTRYGHLSRFAAGIKSPTPSSGPNDYPLYVYVRTGQLIGYSGNTGHSTGPHLHFEVRQARTAIDPEPYLHDPR